MQVVHDDTTLATSQLSASGSEPATSAVAAKVPAVSAAAIPPAASSHPTRNRLRLFRAPTASAAPQQASATVQDGAAVAATAEPQLGTGLQTTANALVAEGSSIRLGTVEGEGSKQAIGQQSDDAGYVETACN